MQRKNEIIAGMVQHHKNGGVCILVTFTFAHGREHSLQESLTGLSSALRRFKSLRVVKNARKQVGYIGQIKATETTHSEKNGWHPHSHEIWFLDQKTVTEYELAKLKASIFDAWRDSCRKYGLSDPDYTHGLDIAFKQGNQTAVGAYLAKWGSELTNAQKKSGYNDSRNPWQMLADLADEKTYNTRTKQLWTEYLKAFHGTRQCRWSDGLREKLAVELLTDEQASETETSKKVCTITRRQYHALTVTKNRPHILNFADLYTPDLVFREICDIENKWLDSVDSHEFTRFIALNCI